MSFEDGWAAMNLEMPRRIPRTEYSADMHWDLIKAVTGIDVGVQSSPALQQQAALAFMKDPSLEKVNDESLTKTLQCIKNLNCERSAKIDFVRSTKENVLAFVPESQKFSVEKQIVSKHREIERDSTTTQKVVLKSTIENSFNPQR